MRTIRRVGLPKRQTTNKKKENVPTSSLSFSLSIAATNTHTNTPPSAPLPSSSLLASSSQYVSESFTPACRIAAMLNATLAAALRTEASGCNKLATSTGDTSPNDEALEKAKVLAVSRSVVTRTGLGTSDIEPEWVDFSTYSAIFFWRLAAAVVDASLLSRTASRQRSMSGKSPTGGMTPTSALVISVHSFNCFWATRTLGLSSGVGDDPG